MPADEYTLMHRCMPVARITIDDRRQCHAIDIEEPEHMPPGTLAYGRACVDDAMTEWLQARLAHEVKPSMAKTFMPTQIHLSLSLSDTYWTCPTGKRLTWSDVNLFENAFHDTTRPDEVYKKRWIMAANGHRALQKFSAYPTTEGTEPYNEVIATEFARVAGFDVVPATLVQTDMGPSSKHPCVTSSYEEFVPAYAFARDNASDRMDANGIRRMFSNLEEHDVDAYRALAEMVVTDMLIRNMDRHWGNFGVLRDPVTLRPTRMMPLFDMNDSLWVADHISHHPVRSTLTGETLEADMARWARPMAGEPNVRYAIREFPDIVKDVLSEYDALQPSHLTKLTDACRVRSLQTMEILSTCQ